MLTNNISLIMKQNRHIFIKQLYQHGDLFFSDRNVYTAPIFNLTPESIPVVAVLHSTHIKNIDALDSSPFKNVYKAMF